MPIFVPFENVISLEHVCAVHGRIVEHLFHFKREAGDPDLGTLTSDVIAARASWKLRVMPLLSVEAVYRNTGARLLSFAGAISASSAAFPISGGVSDEAMPNNVSLRIEKVSGFPGRSFHGSIYIYGIPRGKVTEDEIDSDYLADLQDGIALHVGDMEDRGYTFGVASRRSAGEFRTEGVFTPVTSIIAVDTHIDSRRHRLRGPEI